jgi:hypothetical protein
MCRKRGLLPANIKQNDGIRVSLDDDDYIINAEALARRSRITVTVHLIARPSFQSLPKKARDAYCDAARHGPQRQERRRGRGGSWARLL